MFHWMNMPLRATRYRIAGLLSSVLKADRVCNLGKYLLLVEILRARKIEVIVDVGGNVGQFAQAMRQIGYKGFIVSFEPQAEEFTALSKAMGRDSNWLGINAAAGETEESGEMYRMRSSVCSSFHRPSSAATTQFEEFNTVVEVRRQAGTYPAQE